jgi:2,4-dienoyl-CoA reductase-like NADH-dependent reductase (Old Yellow Enzyme family)
MWRPPQRIKWKTDPGPWPTAQQAADSLLFTPLALGPLQLSSRTWVPAMVPWRATEDGFVTPANIEWYARFATGRPGAIVVEATTGCRRMITVTSAAITRASITRPSASSTGAVGNNNTRTPTALERLRLLPPD